MSEGPIDLAHTPEFGLAGLRVRPSTREIVAADRAPEVLEPRVMQVLVALGRAPGTILSRNDLTRDCWSGRIVGEDSINRVMSRLRRVAEGVGKGHFRIETVTKVGYRLVLLGHSGELAESVVSGTRQRRDRAATATVDRRLLIGGGFLTLLGVGSGGYFLSRRPPAAQMAAPSAEAAALMEQASHSLNQSTREGQNQALGLYRRVVAIAPDYVPGWSALALAYATTAPYRRSSEGQALRARAIEAARRAIALHPDDAGGRAALALVGPRLGGWLAVERALRAALAASPGNSTLLTALAFTLGAVGRATDGLVLQERAAMLSRDPSPGLYFGRITALWEAGRIEEADRLLDEATTIFPTHFALWFARFYILIYSGRATEAIALGEAVDSRPTGIPAGEFESILRVARAIETRDAAAADRAMADQLERARRGAGYAENSIQFASALGRLDQAFAIADAYYFGRGFEVPELRFSPEQATYTPRRERLTAFLFLPSTAPMRADLRFARLCRETGLARYWQQSVTTPDYRLRLQRADA